MLELAKELGAKISIAVAHEYCNVNASSAAIGKTSVIAHRLIEMKHEGYPIVNSIGYFKVMAKEKKWHCKPWAMVNIDPNGNIVLPCYVHNDYASTISISESNVRKAVSEFDWKKVKDCRNAAFTVMLSLLWCFQGIFGRSCIGHFELASNFRESKGFAFLGISRAQCKETCHHLGKSASFCLYIGSWTMHVQKEGISKTWVPSHQEENLLQGN